MVLHAYCVVTGGIPLFCRSIGTETAPSFSELAPLNGVQVFGKLHSVIFKSSEGKNFTIHWKCFTEKLSLIIIIKQAIYIDGEHILNRIFETMVLIVGLDELTNVRYIDRLKKDIRPCYPLIDKILRCIYGGSEIQNSLNLLSMVEVMPCINTYILLDKLIEWSENVCSLFCCLMFENKIIVATPAWWDLTDCEKNLLSSVISSNNACTTIDIPVFLPIKSPNIAFRLVASCLIGKLWVCALCGPTPYLTEFEQSAAFCWNSVVDTLKELKKDDSNILPENLNAQNGFIGALLINYKLGKYIVLGSSADSKEFIDVMRIFYYQNVIELLKEDATNLGHIIRESYWYSDNFKLHALVNNPNVLCVMMSSVIPTYSVRSISKDIFSAILNNKLFLW